MRQSMCCLVAVCFLSAADSPKEDPHKIDLEKMQGDWVVFSMIRDGDKIPDDDAQALFRNVKGNQYTVTRFDRPAGKGTLKIDATKKPKTIDAIPANAPAGRIMLGIYEFEGERFKVCFAMPGQERPKEFVSKEGSGHTLTVWEKEKK